MTDTKNAPRKLVLQEAQGETRDQTKAKAFVSPHFGAGCTTLAFLGSEDLQLMSLIGALNEQADKVHKGDLERLETTLSAQAHSLDVIFNMLAQRAAANMGQYLDATERYLRLALKAQGQCRATLETLATIKNPPVVIARQANIAHGPQQVNNGVEPNAHAHAGTPKQTNELLEGQHGERLDTGATGAASPTDSTMETMAAIDRTKKPRRQGRRQPKRL